tara:strand:+ start:269 stop:400 length:132 start_codon:yes stop_codon:yes gene_type:complete
MAGSGGIIVAPLRPRRVASARARLAFARARLASRSAWIAATAS